MRSTHSLLTCATLLAGTAAADIQFNDFSDVSALNLVGDAVQVGSRLRVAPALSNRVGAAWYSTRQSVDAPFTTEFVVEMNGGSEGMVFVIQQSGSGAIGGTGEFLGYHSMQNCIALELDTNQNLAPSDPSPNHVSLHATGSGANSVSEFASQASTSLLPDLNDGQPHTVRIEYVPGAFRVFVDDLSVPAIQADLDIDQTLDLPDGKAWVGFTASTASNSWQSHDVLSWSFTENATSVSGNQAPEKPTITEPTVPGQIVNPFDVHMEGDFMVDADPGDVHLCSDWEIWTMSPVERVWVTSCIGGVERLHTHLGDGTFMGSHSGQAELEPSRAYVLRARYRDSSGDPWTEWSPWAEMPFQTGSVSFFYPLDIDDLSAQPAPKWTFAGSGTPLTLPVTSPMHALHLESVAGDTLLTIEGMTGGNLLTNPGPLNDHVDVRLRVSAGGAPLNLAESDLEVVDGLCRIHRILLPAINLSAGQEALFWVSSDGATWFATPAQTEPQFTNLARGLALPWLASEPGYQVEVIASGFQLPVNIAFIPNAGTQPGDPYFYVTELYGKIKVVTRDGSVSDYATNLLNFSPTGNFPGSGEQGLAGIVVDAATGDVFASMLYAQGSPHYPKVVRFTSNDGGMTAATQTTILDMNGESQGQSHQISHLEIHPDGKLICHMGDGFDSSTAQNLSSYRGKILRMNLDGSPATDNPFYDPGNGINSVDYVWAYGLRNPFGGRLRASDGKHYEVENGPSIDRFVQINPGVNYLWDGSNTSMTLLAKYTWIPATGPVNLAFIEPETFGGSGFPSSKWDHAFVSLSGGTYAPGPSSTAKRIVEFELDVNGDVVGNPSTLVEYAGPGRSTVVGLAAGPDGLYFTDLYEDTGNNPTASGANVLRVRWVGAQLDCGQIGDEFCTPANLNSTGQPAIIEANGNLTASANDLTLTASQLPNNQFGYFLTSLTQGFVQNPGGSQGNLCLGGQIGRFNAQIQNSSSAGQFSISVDTSALPPPLNTAIVAGQTWSYQCWYRDVNPSATSNFTNGVQVTFE